MELTLSFVVTVFIDTPMEDVDTCMLFVLSCFLQCWPVSTMVLVLCTVLNQLLGGSLEAEEKALLWGLEYLGD